MSEQIFTSCTNAGPISVYVKDGRVVRIRPLVADEKDFTPWTIQAGGRKYTPPNKFFISPYVHGERTRLYSEDRIKYPYKRIDFDPDGERHAENRGKAGYERISWDEALDIVEGEIKRISDTYGSSAITGMTSSHHNWGIVGYKTGPFSRFFNMIGYTPVFDNPDSWEGWHWGATHTYGFFWRLGMPEPYDLLEDALQNAEMIVYWGCDPDSTRGTYTGQDSAIWRQWLKEKGVKMVFIDPFYNYTNAAIGGKWLPIRMGTGTALAMAIAFVWLTEGTFDKDYIETHTIGFDEFREHILGEDDGQPKTPVWASEESGIPARKIKALAREWASKKTVLAGGTRGGEGGACREAYATEWARMMVLLQAMQGLGKPGVSIWGTSMGAPSNADVFFPGYADLDGRMATSKAANRQFGFAENPTKQRLYRLTLPDAILNPPVSWMGEGFCGQALEQQFTEFTYPMPDHSEIKMFYRYGGSFIGTMSDTNKWVRMYQSPKLEFVVNQDCWYNSETNFADIILPACTSLERDDVGEWGAPGGYTGHASSGCNNRVIIRQKKCIEPLWESRSDYQIFSMIADRLGLKETYTSESLKQCFPDDEERPVSPRYIPSWEGHRSELAKKYPLALVSPHPRFSFHTHYDKHTDWLNEIPVHRVKKDGYPWWPARIHPSDAGLRGIRHGDIVKLYNDRGGVLCIAEVTERIRPGIIHSYASSALYDPLEPGKAGSVDQGGCINILTSSRMLSKNAPGMTPNSCLIDIEKWEG